ncbi:MAG TPA: hypothetical protein VKA59_11295 [Vicinamibacterales bacterium]|nr:hypothetical protein [Vicinamibacterales bacterium]
MSRWPLMVRGLVIAVCGVLLALGGCLGFLSTTEATEALASVLGITMAIGALAAFFGCVLFIGGVFKWLFGSFSPQSGE